jgi:hypothetical protein
MTQHPRKTTSAVIPSFSLVKSPNFPQYLIFHRKPCLRTPNLRRLGGATASVCTTSGIIASLGNLESLVDACRCVYLMPKMQSVIIIGRALVSRIFRNFFLKFFQKLSEKGCHPCLSPSYLKAGYGVGRGLVRTFMDALSGQVSLVDPCTNCQIVFKPVSWPDLYTILFTPSITFLSLPCSSFFITSSFLSCMSISLEPLI